MARRGMLLAALCCMICCGCEGSKSAPAPAAGKQVASDKDESVVFTVKGKHGETARVATDEQGVSLPKDFPSDVPIYRGATVLTAVEMQGKYNVTLKTTDSIQQVFSFYEDKLKTGGWKIGATMGSKQTKLLNATKGTGSLMVVVGKADDKGTVINLGVEGK